MARVEITFGGQSRGAVEAAHATATALKDVRKQAGESSVTLGHHSKALKEGEQEMGRFARGAAAGSGLLSHFGRSVAFASSGVPRGRRVHGGDQVVDRRRRRSWRRRLSTTTACSAIRRAVSRRGRRTRRRRCGSRDRRGARRRGDVRDAALEHGRRTGEGAPMSKSLVQLAVGHGGVQGRQAARSRCRRSRPGSRAARAAAEAVRRVLDQTRIKQEAERDGLVQLDGRHRQGEGGGAAARDRRQRLADQAIEKHGAEVASRRRRLRAKLHKAQDACEGAARATPRR
jgi:hypothetical protein